MFTNHVGFCQIVSFSLNNSNTVIEIMTNSNFNKWKYDIEFALGIMKLNIAVQENEPPKPTINSTPPSGKERINLVFLLRRESLLNIYVVYRKLANIKDFLDTVKKGTKYIIMLNQQGLWTNYQIWGKWDYWCERICPESNFTLSF